MIRQVLIGTEAYSYLVSHNLLERFSKAAHKIIAGNNRGADLKKRKPLSKDVWSFRITKKYRAFAHKHGNVLKVFKIDDHQ